MLTTCVLLALIGPQKLNWNGPASFTVRGKSHGHSYSVTFKQSNFATQRRRLEWKREQEDVYVPAWRVGHKLFEFTGFDGFPREEVKAKSPAAYLKHCTELTSLIVIVDGREWLVRKRLYAGYINPDLGLVYPYKDKADAYETVNLSSNGTTLRVSMSGSDGGGGYTAHWIFRRSGKHSVTVDGPP